MEDDRLPAASLARYWDLLDFQTNIASRWLKRGTQIDDPFAKFLFFFAGFNAIYFLWTVIDDVDKGEGHQIRNVVDRLGERVAADVLRGLEREVGYFCERRPVERMDRRGADPTRGEHGEGRRHREILKTSDAPLKRLNALAQILYLVRSNLAHGSKGESGDDLEVVAKSIPALQLLLEQTLHMSQAATRGR